MMRSAMAYASLLVALSVSLATLPGAAEKEGRSGEDKGKSETRAEAKLEQGSKGNRSEFRKEVRTPSGVKVDIDKKAGSRAEVRVETRSRAEHRGNGREADKARDEEREVRREIRDERRTDKRETREEIRESVHEDRREIFRNVQKEARERREEARETSRNVRTEGSETALRERVVFVQGTPTDDPDVILVDINPDNEEFIARLIRAHRDDQGWLDRFAAGLPFGIRRNFEVGRTVPPGLFKRVSLLPLEVNEQLGLPVDAVYRVGVLDNKLVLFDVERRLVLDIIEYEDEDLLLADIRLPSDKLYVYRIDDADKNEVITFLRAHPGFLRRDESFGERFRRTVLVPIGIADGLVIGDSLPSDIEISLLPVSLNAQLGLPETDLRLGLYGDDLVLIDPRTAVIIDVDSNII